jgi:hypothetical protein
VCFRKTIEDNSTNLQMNNVILLQKKVVEMNKNLFSSAQFILWLAFLVAFPGCSEEVQRSLKSVPTAFGKVNQLIVVADEDLWESEVGDTFRYYYSAAYPILPQPEPIFDLKHFTPSDLISDPLRKELRNYLFLANMDDNESATTQLILKDIGEEKVRRAKEEPKYNTSVGRDKWAKGQLLIYQFGFSRDELIKNVKQNFPAISKKINEADKKKIEATVYLDGENELMKEKLRGLIGVNLRIPNDYIMASDSPDMIWLRKETYETSSNILLRKLPYTDQTQLTKAGIKEIRNELGKNISSEIPDTYMKINDIDLPMLSNVKTMNNYYAVEARGIWELANDYMGGAFVSYLIHNPTSNELLFVDGFVHAPGKDKREYMQYLEHIISSVKF